MLGSLETCHPTAGPSKGSLHGEPVSPGRTSVPFRAARWLEDLERYQEGGVLVAQAKVPAWTPLFERTAAVVTDGDSLAAHASLVARE